VISVNAENLPWVLIGVLLAAVVAVFYAMLRGNIVPRSVSDRLLESSEKRAEIAEAGVAANTDTVRTLVDQLEKLTVLAENQDRVLRALRDGAAGAWNRGGS
jgi:uncharacterized sporulation protein YeaH/YhbH (DUF444 family)